MSYVYQLYMNPDSRFDPPVPIFHSLSILAVGDIEAGNALNETLRYEGTQGTQGNYLVDFSCHDIKNVLIRLNFDSHQALIKIIVPEHKFWLKSDNLFNCSKHICEFCAFSRINKIS